MFPLSLLHSSTFNTISWCFQHNRSLVFLYFIVDIVMDTKNITYISNLTTENIATATLKLKILSVWNRTSKTNPTEVQSIEMVMVDEQGTKIQAQCMKSYKGRFEKVLNDESCLYIYKPTFATKDYAKVKIVKKQTQKLSLSYTTMIKKCRDFSLNGRGFQFASFEDILTEKIKSYDIVDVIGYVESCFNKEPIKMSGGSESYKTRLILRDVEDVELRVDLWKKEADQLDEYLANKKSDSKLFVALQFGQTNKYNGSIYVSTFYDTSRFFINDGALEIADFKERYLSRHQVGSSSSSSRIVRGLDEDFVNKHSFSSIASIVEPLEPMKVSIVATITAVYPSGQWSYLACPKCNTTVKTGKSESQREDGSSDSSGHWCSKCNAAVTEAVDRYKVPIVVDDCTGSVTLTLFDRDVVGLIHLH